MISDPSFQQSAAHVEAMVADDPDLKKQADRIVEGMKDMTAEMVNPSVQGQAKRVAERMEAIVSDPSFQEKMQNMAMQMETLLADPELKRQSDRMIEEMKDMAAIGLDAVGDDPVLASK